jgi:hypothetical protein
MVPSDKLTDVATHRLPNEMRFFDLLGSEDVDQFAGPFLQGEIMVGPGSAVTGYIPDDNAVMLRKIGDLKLKEAMIHGGAMGENDRVLPSTLHPIMDGAMDVVHYFVFHNEVIRN